MNYVPINGLRLLAIETGILVGLTCVAFFFLRFVKRQYCLPDWVAWILAEDWRAVLLVFALALVGRALVLPWVGVPQPRINDEYSYLLMGDTFAHFRLANPTPADWPHFETFHVNLTPTYHSKYPVAQGLFLAFGEIVFHQPWVGICLSTALMCGAICWTLQAFVPPGWALIGGLLAVARFGIFSYWVNSYWGGSVAALGGALALGAVTRLFEDRRTESRRIWLSSTFGVALLLLASSRPFEGFAFALPLLLYFLYRLLKQSSRGALRVGATVLPVVLIGVAGLSLMGYYNLRTTGHPLLMPYVLNERTYASIPLFLGQHVHHDAPARDPVFAKYYQVEYDEHGLAQTKSLSGLIGWEVERWAVNWFFFLGPALSLPALIGILLCVKQPPSRLVLAAAVTTAIAVSLCTFTQVHYFAPATVAVFVFVVVGLRYLWDEPGTGERAFMVAAVITAFLLSLMRTTASTAMNAGFRLPDTRNLVAAKLDRLPGKHLVLVSYDMARHYPGDELVHNFADFSSQKILWARSKGTGNDFDLCQAYADRTFWAVMTDDETFSLQPSNLCKNTDITRP